MFEFTLSKLNLLIFVTAIAAIVLFFMNTVNSNLKTRQSFELVYKIGKEIKSGMDSESYCSVKYIDIPKQIKTKEGHSTAYNVNYVLNVASYDFEDEEGYYDHKLVLAVMDRKETKIYAAYDVDYKGEINFYKAEHNDTSGDEDYEKITSTDNYVVYDPLRERSNDTTLIFLKKTENQQNYFYLLPCSKKNGQYTCQKFICNSSDFKSLSCKNIQLCATNIGDNT